MKRICLLVAIMAVTMTLLCASPVEGNVMTPYLERTSPDEYYAGTTFDLGQDNLSQEYITAELERMSSLYNINTITVYGLENIPQNLRNHIFDELDRLCMKIVVRIESYDADEFAFTRRDAYNVLSIHAALLDYVCSGSRMDQVAYFAVNMPVDDTRVQANAGGLNTSGWQDAQVEYAEIIIGLLRSYLSERGYDDARLYLSVHYGWDNSFAIPSYVSAGADGYFINCYSYPVVRYGRVPKADEKRDVLIDTPHIDECMRLYMNQYGDAPVVMEFGFHTLEYNDWIKPDQTAGLVWDREAKKKAMQETIRYYEEKYPFVEGALYFGFNLLKEEGNDGAVMDWCLEYPAQDTAGWADAYLSGGAYVDNGNMVLRASGDSVSFRDVSELQEIVIRYCSTSPADIKVTANGRTRKQVTLPATDGYEYYPLPVIVVEGYELGIESASDQEVSIASVILLGNLEPEYSVTDPCTDNAASQGMYVRGIVDKNDPVTFEGVRGGERIVVCYRADEDCTLFIVLDGRTARFPLSASNDFITAEAGLPIYRDATLSFYSDSADLELDYIRLEGIPGVKK